MTALPQSTTKPKTDRYHRAPKGGAISMENGLFYKGGQFMPLVSTEKVWSLLQPAPLAGSVRQVAWANRLRREAIDRLSDEIHVRRLFLAEPTKATDLPATRAKLRALMVTQHTLLTTRSAASIIERRGLIA